MEHAFELLKDIAFSIIFATLCAHGARLLRQPLIIGYVAGGILLGRHMGLGLVTGSESIELISEIGLLFLLFIIGLEINLKELFRMGPSMITLGLVQFVGCVALGLALYGWFGWGYFKDGVLAGRYDLLYLAVTTALSSTLIVVKLLADKFEVNTTAGRLTVGVLVLQDIWAMLFMAFQPNLLNPEWLAVIRSIGLGLLLTSAAFVMSRHVLNRIFAAAAKKPELVLLTAMTWCFVLAGLAERAGLSKEMGALIAGLSLAAYPYGADVIAKLIGVRDFFVTLFFVSLGLKMPLPEPGLLAGAVGVAIVVVLSRFVTVIPVTALFGNGARIGVVTALNLSQISEFSLVIVALGIGYGHVSQQLQTLVLTSMLMTSVVSTYLIFFNGRIAAGVMKVFGLLRPSQMREKKMREEKFEPEIVLLGCFREGLAFLDKLEQRLPALKAKLLAVDFNQALAGPLQARGFVFRYADLAHAETLEHLGIEKARLVICSLSDTYLKGTTGARLLSQLRRVAPQARFIMTADDARGSEELKKAGALEVAVASESVGSELFTLLQRHPA
ncbi:MAG TPA: cation:proton antiporter [Verrucomicrobiae bacterium]|nr:cation:proton antiporter [Verrucomicrobiae bacterium]